MRLTTKGRYAVTAMLDLAIHNDQGPISLADISGRQGISLSYLEQLFARLRKRGLVLSTRGPGGGYTLSRPPSELAIADVISAVDEKVDTTRCGGTVDCQNNERCLTHDLWSDLSRQIYDFLANITLGDVMKRNGVQEVAARQDRAMGGQPVSISRASVAPVSAASESVE
ncbi:MULTISPECIES: Fe-S cluster assembly transcription factor [Ectothiorhodospira]|uniref:Transcriptional regulator, BadM/Rrf2 family n=1 Tax=Ectothiorhodospira marina TaxID=1396821 RepID=A0A1H7FPU1_9GAMM|nr:MULTISPECIES: Fe-S cluster assembly transcription factor [Ectothiorhodospira]MCG5515382.1 Fe-S cluster assembly transcription factor [Ectothiorhodospira sp. 9100]MCG5518265.1 Fe-S cluster assembly transcription factor [Ectothiorhodospira sp. 9905]SEK26170.1 transcriptional regulator, BadM/Rrf2 family [Ectothiorhodospira marina]